MRIIEDIKPEEVLFLDIKTHTKDKLLVEGTDSYRAYELVYQKKDTELTIQEDFDRKAYLFAEFSEISCVCVGVIKDGRIVVKEYSGEESEILKRLNSDIALFRKKRGSVILCGHSLKTYDLPFIFKRCLANGIRPDNEFDVSGLKPWELSCIDTKELWQGTSYYSSSLSWICNSLGVPLPICGISGKELSDSFHDGDLDKILECCISDVKSTINCFLKMKFQKIISTVERRSGMSVESENLMSRILRTGQVNEDDWKEIIEKSRDLTYEEKERYIDVLKVAFIQNGLEMPEQLELEILE